MASSIGIKIANGEFYSILEENSSIKKRLILTTVHDNQPSMQIDLYRSTVGAMTDAQYIGSLVVDSIRPKRSGEPSIEMIITSNSDGEIIANAIDLDGGENYALTVSLKSLDEVTRDMELPDFELDDSLGNSGGFTDEEPPIGLYKHAEQIRNEEKIRKSPSPWLFILIGLLIILGLAAVWLFLLGGMETVSKWWNKTAITQTAPQIQFPAPEPVREPEPIREPEPVVIEPVPEPVREPEPEIVRLPESEPEPEIPPVIQAPPEPPPARPVETARRRPPPPVASYRVPATIPPGGVAYTIRWGDTLWDIAAAFYRNPWLYPRIARHNNIRNPDYIISGRTIRIPPRN